ncbi:hypothetical protein TNCV_2570971 [Trichonephila clavipes]|nr:hypothetical protein TNCV_2570971 [Trichonephila clavipes]
MTNLPSDSSTIMDVVGQSLQGVQNLGVRDFSAYVFQLQETKLPVRLINTTNEWRLAQRHETPLRVKGDIEDVSSELDNESLRLHFLDEMPIILLLSISRGLPKGEKHDKGSMSQKGLGTSDLIHRKLITKKRSCTLQWTPAHANILGNEKAEELAKEFRAFPNHLASRPSSTPMQLPAED